MNHVRHHKTWCYELCDDNSSFATSSSPTFGLVVAEYALVVVVVAISQSQLWMISCELMMMIIIMMENCNYSMLHCFVLLVFKLHDFESELGLLQITQCNCKLDSCWSSLCIAIVFARLESQKQSLDWDTKLRSCLCLEEVGLEWPKKLDSQLDVSTLLMMNGDSLS